MTRWILLVLVIANLGYFGWNQWRPTPGGVSGAAESSQRNGGSDPVPELRLVGEDAAGQSLATAASQVPAEVSGVVDKPASDRARPTVEPETALGAPAVALDDRLLAWVARNCLMIAPLESAARAADVEEALRDQDLPAGREIRNVLDRTLYWVYLAPAASRQEALQASRTLRAQGIDNFIIESDLPIRNGISVGVFNERESADRHVAAMRQRGLDPAVFADEKFEQSFALRVEPLAGPPDLVRLERALAVSFGPGAQWPLQICEPIASAAAVD